MKDLLNGYKQHAPYMVEIEPTEGCNLGCSFCGLRGIREKGTKPWNLMTIEDAKVIARKIKEAGWQSRIVFCGHGEPTINPNLLDIIKVFRNELPKNKFQLICNGYGFKNGLFNISEFFSALEEINFNDVVFDVYSDNGDWTAVKEVRRIEDLAVIGENGEGINYDGKGMRVALYPIKTEKKFFRRMDNHCGAAFPLDEKDNDKRCEKPFRFLFIRWNAFVCLCCDDFRGQYKIGSVLDFEKIDDLWNSPSFQAIRIMLFKGRKFKPCWGCTHSPIRAGLLPDPSARDKGVMPSEMSEDVRKVIEDSYDENGSTLIVKRKWEK